MMSFMIVQRTLHQQIKFCRRVSEPISFLSGLTAQTCSAIPGATRTTGIRSGFYLQHQSRHLSSSLGKNASSGSGSKAYIAMKQKKAQQIREKFVKVGIPLIIFVVGGSYFLSVFMSTHMEIKDRNNNSKSERNFNLEEEHKLLMKKLDIDNFSLSRIPRPDDDALPNGNSKKSDSNEARKKQRFKEEEMNILADNLQPAIKMNKVNGTSSGAASSSSSSSAGRGKGSGNVGTSTTTTTTTTTSTPRRTGTGMRTNAPTTSQASQPSPPATLDSTTVTTPTKGWLW